MNAPSNGAPTSPSALPTQELVELALAASAADGCVVLGTDRSQTNLRWANNSLTTNGQTSSRSLTVISTTVSGQVGVVSRSVSTPEQVQQLVRASEAAASASTRADDVAPLVEPYPNDDDWAGDPARTSIEVFSELTDGLGPALATARTSDRALFGFAEHLVTSTYLGTSTGLRRRHDQPTGRLELNAKSPDYVRSAWNGVQTRDFRDVDVAEMTTGLTERLGWARRSIELPAGRYETLLPPSCVADLLLMAYFSAAARDAAEGRSVFSGRAAGVTRLGERLSDVALSLYSDPAEPGLETAPFAIAHASQGAAQSVFDNGAPRERTDWVRDGALTTLASNRSYAAAAGAFSAQEPAHPFIDNLIGDAGGTKTLPEMIADTERGLLLTTLWYIREVDPQTLLVTGLTRDGVYLIENGEVQGAVNNFRFNESPVDLLGRITQVGRTEATLPREMGDWFSRAAMPTLRVRDFTMSSVSAAS